MTDRIQKKKALLKGIDLEFNPNNNPRAPEMMPHTFACYNRIRNELLERIKKEKEDYCKSNKDSTTVSPDYTKPKKNKAKK